MKFIDFIFVLGGKINHV